MSRSLVKYFSDKSFKPAVTIEMMPFEIEIKLKFDLVIEGLLGTEWLFRYKENWNWSQSILSITLAMVNEGGPSQNDKELQALKIVVYIF